MNYNLINLHAFNELPKVIKRLYMIHEDYESSSLISISIIVDLTIMLLNATADVIISDGEFVGVGDYACKGVKHGAERDSLLPLCGYAGKRQNQVYSGNNGGPAV